MTQPVGRVALLDAARGFALLHMVAFHFLFDLRMLGVPPGWIAYGPWFDNGWNRAIAGSFLFLAGVSLWLAHGDGIRWRGFLTRLGILAAAAGAVSLGTYLAVPEAWVRFGILHSIAACSVLCLAVLRLPWWLTTAAAIALLVWGPGLSFPAFDGAAWVWTGLGQVHAPMIDYEPVVPWIAPMMLGVAAGRLGTARGLWARLARVEGGRLGAALGWAGRHSLVIYLLHQPLLMGGILGWLWLMR
ncbi:heparan-alpha-glucosaminide N-acetyltransferase [Jannaschia seohaensis]|uniref:Putative membrane protein n=1 Tax=Jannaschia seohaensis TaxID=475081 RepID=A0A2Y9ARM2_9RHOB|nr:heparan-alpha-glucosaminide N-acetyltransferase [Jannaschia seohaensis]PWJ18211.1 putative membrane protein [Jannaschia seohaensis]SSA46736.1 Uncharacterized membrane protein [Jannaschia seohaensis]